MGNRLTNRGIEVLKSLARHRLLSIEQLGILHFTGLRMARRERNKLDALGLIETIPRENLRKRGRREQLATLSEKGLERLKEKDIVEESVRFDQVSARGFKPTEHQLLLNWIDIHMSRLDHVNGDLETEFLSSVSPFLPPPREGMKTFLSDAVPAKSKRGKPRYFTPDGVFMIRSHQRGKSLLFFVEVDMDTEQNSIIVEKIQKYQIYFRSEGYKRYERYWKDEFKGFRLLFVVNTNVRLSKLSHLARRTPPSDFVWLADEDSLHAGGISDKIWFRGGRSDSPRESILGPEFACKAPLSQIKD